MEQRQQGAKRGQGTSPAAPSGSKAERVLAYMVASTIGVSILSFLAIIVATLAGMDSAAFGTGVWPAVALLPLIGLPIGFILMISLIVLSLRRRSREAAALAAAPPSRRKAR